mmetsp:Transcript_18741/g.38609  ORF Transcript_18741/g.38609 Transcript_18741/m.38609 type:complete len:447 (-) Transcript_18741:137-1477(-)
MVRAGLAPSLSMSMASRLSEALFSSFRKSQSSGLQAEARDGQHSADSSGSPAVLETLDALPASSVAEAKSPLGRSGIQAIQATSSITCKGGAGIGDVEASPREPADTSALPVSDPSDVVAPCSSRALLEDLQATSVTKRLRSKTKGPSDAPTTPRRSLRLKGLPPETPSPLPRPARALRALGAYKGPEPPSGKRKLPELRQDLPNRCSFVSVLEQARSSGPGGKPSEKKGVTKGKKAGVKPRRQTERPNTLQPSMRQRGLLRVPALTQIPAIIFKSWKPSPSKRPLPKRCRMPPLQAWRNERVVYERTPSSQTPSVVAVEVDMTRSAQAPNRNFQLPALQAPLEAMEASEFVGICTSRLRSRVLALPDRGDALPCTVGINGPGILHVLDGSLRIAKEGAAKETQLSAGSFLLVKDSDKRLVAPPRTGPRPRPNTVGVRFLWVEVRK